MMDVFSLQSTARDTLESACRLSSLESLVDCVRALSCRCSLLPSLPGTSSERMAWMVAAVSGTLALFVESES